MRALLIAGLVGTSFPALAQHAGHGQSSSAPAAEPKQESVDSHAGHAMGAQGDEAPPPVGPPPVSAFEGPAHAADAHFDPAAMAAAREALRAEQGGMRTWKVMVERAEARIRDERDGYAFEADAWWGGDIDKLWLKAEGEGALSAKPEAMELQLLWSRAIDPWFDLQAGLRHDFRPDPERSHLVLGVQGHAPYFIELDAAAFLSDEGEATARVEVAYDQLLTQRLVLQPRLEFGLSAREVRELEMGSGLTSAELGLRLRYEIVPEFAPYVGVEYERKFGGTADFARDEGEDAGEWSLLLGVRIWF